METIKITCQTCHSLHEVNKTKEIPKKAISMNCNWCPNCEDRAKDYYKESFNYDDRHDNKKLDDVPKNQLVMPFFSEEIETIFNENSVIEINNYKLEKCKTL